MALCGCMFSAGLCSLRLLAAQRRHHYRRLFPNPRGARPAAEPRRSVDRFFRENSASERRQERGTYLDGSRGRWRAYRSDVSEAFPSSHPRWSPDGKYIAFLSARNESKEQVWLLNRLGGEAERLTYTPQDVDELAWSPDGSRLALLLRDASLRRTGGFEGAER